MSANTSPSQRLDQSVESQVIFETPYRCAKCRKVNFVTTLQSVKAEFPHGFPQNPVEIWHLGEVLDRITSAQWPNLQAVNKLQP
jgi:hypothetical protein